MHCRRIRWEGCCIRRFDDAARAQAADEVDAFLPGPSLRKRVTSILSSERHEHDLPEPLAFMATRHEKNQIVNYRAN